MFISIKWKNTIVFTLMITAILSIICCLNVAGIRMDARSEFKETISSVFTDEYMQEITNYASSAYIAEDI